MAGPNSKPENIQVLVVDDQDLMRKSVIKVLKKMHFDTVFDAPNGAEAKKIFDEQPIELVISDLYMGAFDGFRLLMHVRNADTRSDAPLIVITGEGSKEDIVKAVDLGADDYVLKPFQPEDLEKKITKALGKYLTPNPLLAIIRRAEFEFAEKKLNEAMALVEKALTQEPNSARANHLKGVIYARAGQLDLAIQTLRKNVRVNPSFYKSFATIADVYLKDNKPGEAIKAMVEELSLNPKQPHRQTELAKLYMSQGNVEEAINHFRNALRDDGKLQKALYGMGMAYAAADNVEKAIYYFKRLRRNHPSVTKALEAMVKVAVDGKEPRMAELALREEKKSYPDRIDTYFVLARFLNSQDKPEDAIPVLADLLKRAPDNIEALQLKAMTHIRVNQLDEGINCFRLLLQKQQSPMSFLYLGDALIKKGSFVEAIDVLHKAISLKANAPQVLFRLGEAYLRTNQYLKAWSVFRRLRRMGLSDKALLESEKKATGLIHDRRKPKINVA